MNESTSFHRTFFLFSRPTPRATTPPSHAQKLDNLAVKPTVHFKTPPHCVFHLSAALSLFRDSTTPPPSPSIPANHARALTKAERRLFPPTTISQILTVPDLYFLLFILLFCYVFLFPSLQLVFSLSHVCVSRVRVASAGAGGAPGGVSRHDREAPGVARGDAAGGQR